MSVLTVHAPDANALIDMMRYDRCCPFLRADADKLGRLIDRSGDRADRVVQLLRFASTDAHPPEGRWRSFMCSILDERPPGVEQLTTADLRDEDALTEIAASRDRARTSKRRQRQARFASAVSVHASSAAALIKVMQDGCCCPAYETESGKIERLIGDRAEARDRVVQLTRFAGSDDPPDVATWHTLGVDVLDERPLDVTWPTDAELAHLASLPWDVRGDSPRW